MRDDKIGYMITDSQAHIITGLDDETAGRVIKRALSIARGTIVQASGEGIDLLGDVIGYDVLEDRMRRLEQIKRHRDQQRQRRRAQDGDEG